MTALEPRSAGPFWERLGPAIDTAFGRPRAVLVASAHTLARVPTLFAAARHEAVHDFGGFPEPLYRLRYPAPGAPELASETAALLGAAGLPAEISGQSGLDHGIWIPLRSIYPQGDVPVLPLAWNPHASPSELMALGHALQRLCADGVLVVGSGAITHNLRLWAGGRDPVDAPERAESASFREWMHEKAEAADWTALADYRRLAPSATFMHPTDEHLLPWFIAAGAAGAAPAGRRLHASVDFGHLGMDSYAFGAGANRLAHALEH
jgi:4,5-DOPA dioxygenase extradiol